MSKIKLQGNASGTGVLTVTAPNTSTDRTITLPDSTGTILDENSSLPAANLTGTVADARISTLTASKLTGALPAISGASLTNLPASGITQADQWRLHTDFTGDVNPVINWERDDTTPFSKIGAGMSENTGIFTFPTTGIYKVEYVFTAKLDGDSRNVYGYIVTTEDNSNYYNRAGLETHIQRTQSNQTLCTAYGSCFVDVTDTSNIKVKFSAYSVDTSRTMLGRSNYNSTYVTFTRLGDT